MNNIVNLSQLIGRVAKATQTDPNTARRFLRAFFAVVEDGLAAGESVHVKGIGTFCRIDDPGVGAPGSVGFAPDPDFSAAVNKPFAMFEAVELADGLTAADLEVPDTSSCSDNSDDSSDPSDSSDISNVSDSSDQPESSEESEPSEEPSEPSELFEPSEEPTTEPSEPAIEEEPRQRSRWWIWAVIGVVLAIGIGFGAAVLSTPMPDFSDDEEETIPAPTAPSDSTSETALSVAEEADTATIHSVTPAPAQEAPAAPEPKPESPKEPTYDTIRAGYYPSSMARKYYGHSIYWVFIYEANKDILKNPDRIPVGTRLLIPDKNSLPGADEAERMAIAEQLNRDIKKRYK